MITPEIEVGGIPSITNVWDLMNKFADQIDFATSLGINYTADDVVNAEQVQINKIFTIRRPWMKRGTQFGVNVKPANKKNLQASVFSRAPWLKLQNQGGIKHYTVTTPGRDRPLILIPTQNLRQNSNRLIPARYSPKKLLANMEKNQVFWIGDNLWHRMGAGTHNIEPLFFGVDAAKVRAVLEYESTARAIIVKVYQNNWGKALAYAIATAKGK